MHHLNLIKRHIDHILLGQILVIAAFGLIMLYSASSAQSVHLTGGKTNSMYLTAHLKRLLIALCAMTAFIFIDYRKLKQWAPILIGVSVGLLSLGLILKIVSGSTFPARWIHLGPFTFQTSDFARLSVIIYLAAYLDTNHRKVTDFTNGLLPPMLMLVAIFTLIVLQPDFSTAMVIVLIGFVILFIGGSKISQLMACGSIGIALSVPILLLKSYRLDRLLAWFNHEGANNYQASQSLISLGNGGLFGLGLGQSMQKDQFLPTPHTDFIFAIIGEETGFLGGMFLLFLFILIYRRGIKIAKECTDPFGIFLAVGIGFNLICYTFINVAVVTGILPVTGLQIPMVSYGGSGLIVTLIEVGILLNISQRKRSVFLSNLQNKRIYG
ncbi:MAG: putative peptidoglycan glycosyltransferase FtsW [Candidatus Marinimicrobia bacterium]|jgi:cell division protein FtsW|nr:putative peptidoglycan glycosyltransferase FtsW [Candidatus Neomarinimicrobiota bacterium]HJM47043.1 putative peptidoglycan glycosyltransferase FtsW [Candidatus Neomarinimicrobiota bacterium]|tara:strand:- start:8663 stop:9808 length:1146 start_codon:yes stop_codon:yes gene_type:complete